MVSAQEYYVIGLQSTNRISDQLYCDERENACAAFCIVHAIVCKIAIIEQRLGGDIRVGGDPG